MIARLAPLLLLCAAASTIAADFPPTLPGGARVGSGSSPDLLQPTETLRGGIAVASEAPAVDFLYYECQTYEPKPGVWSAWGDGLAAGDKFYSSVGDHSSPGGNAFLYEYDSAAKSLRLCTDLRGVLRRPDGHYTPGKIHSRIDLGSDGWLYFSTHRGSTKVGLNPENHFEGDWILRHHPAGGKTEIVAAQPLPMQCLPTGLLDPERLIFYAGTADGLNKDEPQFLAYDVSRRKGLYADAHGPYRYLIYAPSRGAVYFHGETAAGKKGAAPLVRFDPENPGKPVPVAAEVGLRAATIETPAGKVYTIDGDELWEFDTKAESARSLGAAAAAGETYTASLDIDPKTWRYLYYVPGAHGGAHRDGSPLIQYDLETKKRKVIAFLHPYLYQAYGYIPCGTYSTAVSPDGGKVYITWNGNTGTAKADLGGKIKFNTCALTVVHVPESERP